MARIKIVYLGGGSSRGAGTMASLLEQGANFNGSEVVLVDLEPDRLAVVQKIAAKIARNKGLDITITTSTDRRAALRDCDAVLSSFRPGGFEARYLDESIPLKHGVLGQETQGPGGFFMALRSIHVLKQTLADMEEICPNARLFNYTNPVNIVAQAVSRNSPIPVVSLCEGPITFYHWFGQAAGLDIAKMDVTMIGLNHACWSIHHEYEGQDIIPILAEALARRQAEPNPDPYTLRMLKLAVTMNSIPASYFQYYYYNDEVLNELRERSTTRAQDIMSGLPDYWTHYREQAESDAPQLDPRRSRGGVHELELALDVMDAYYNDRGEVWPVNTPNRGAMPDFPDDFVVEVPGYVDRHGITPLVQNHMPPQTLGLLKALGEYQSLAADAAWAGTRTDAIRALASNPLVLSLSKAETIYDEMAGALQEYLPARLLK
ncbi:6-phospho-beta-glucosidase [Capsulimonas corticalis]|uniref:6-phospho-beta-glucosidase n=1 Tax=Capsulimonas corticalis TaxID=2219043 RepID=A0A402D6C1_9BACT|nr:glycoside hydrolase [Capsulimonas corticalis]BDI32049.1 6-phospho-beta-glucosidase [Capsulimonas corticalis]